MEDDSFTIPLVNSGEDSGAASSSSSSGGSGTNHGWQKVVSKRQRKQPKSSAVPLATAAENGATNGTNVFASIEQRGVERRRAIEAAAAAASESDPAPLARSRLGEAGSDDSEEDSGGEAANAIGEAEKAKKTKSKKPKITVADAASKIDSSDLATFLGDVSQSFETQPDIQLMRFADYFGRAFSSVSASQFAWSKMFKESPVAKLVDIPLCHISESVYKTSTDWIAQRPGGALGDFVLWCLDSILTKLASQQAAAKGSKKTATQASPKGQVAIFVVLAMTLRRKPEVLINILPQMRENPKYQGQEKLPVIIWTAAQASLGELVVGMYVWAHYLLPSISGKLNNPQSRDLVLQLLERLLSGPKARPVLLNGAVRKGERLIPPSTFDLLMRATFPAASARVKATERFEAAYPLLKELALAGSPGTKTTNQASQHLLPLTAKAMEENNPELTGEAANIFIWCLTQNPDCYRQWEKLHLDNVAASSAVLRKLCQEWKLYSVKLSPPDKLRDTLVHLRDMNLEAVSEDEGGSRHSAIAELDKYCKILLARLTRSFGCRKCGIFTLTVAIAACALILAPKLESLDLKALLASLSVPKSV